MAFIDVVEWNPKSNNIYAFRFPNSNLSTATQLIVRESQEAVLFSKGQIMGKFGPGKHKLTTENIPLLRNLYGIPFGGKNPFVAEVWFVNKTATLNIDWTTTPMRFMDPDYGQMIPLVAKGRYGLKVEDAERFLIELVGTLYSFTDRELSDHFMGALCAKTNSNIMAFMNTNRVGINSIAAYLDDLSNFIGQPMAEFWRQYGFKLAGFYITEVNLDTSSTEGRKISEALSQRSSQGIAGYTWQQEQSFNVANNAAKNGSGMGIMGAAMMAGGFMNGGSMMQPNYNQGVNQPSYNNPGYPQQSYQQSGFNQGYNQQNYNNPGFNQPNPNQFKHIKVEVFCSRCGRKYPTSSKFCPFCGDIYNPCPACGADNDLSATRCVTCGTMLQNGQTYGNVCSVCNQPVQPGVKFCPNCGNKI